jgi:hypothetical protein
MGAASSQFAVPDATPSAAFPFDSAVPDRPMNIYVRIEGNDELLNVSQLAVLSELDANLRTIGLLNRHFGLRQKKPFLGVCDRIRKRDAHSNLREQRKQCISPERTDMEPSVFGKITISITPVEFLDSCGRKPA